MIKHLSRYTSTLSWYSSKGRDLFWEVRGRGSYIVVYSDTILISGEGRQANILIVCISTLINELPEAKPYYNTWKIIRNMLAIVYKAKIIL